MREEKASETPQDQALRGRQEAHGVKGTDAPKAEKISLNDLTHYRDQLLNFKEEKI